jgi:outer membrane protein TolC
VGAKTIALSVTCRFFLLFCLLFGFYPLILNGIEHRCRSAARQSAHPFVPPLGEKRKDSNLSFGLSSSDSEDFTQQILGFSVEVNGQGPFTRQKNTRDASKVPEAEGEKPKTQVSKDSFDSLASDAENTAGQNDTTLANPDKDPSALTLRAVIQETLQNQWSIYSSEFTIQSQLGLYQQAAGAFNLQFNSSFSNLSQFDLQSPLGIRSNFTGRFTSTSLALTKLSRSGATYNLSYSNLNTLNPFIVTCIPPRSDNTILTVSIEQPILRNFWYSPTTILELTQGLAFEASRLQNIQNIANAIAASLIAYWNCVGAKLIYETYLELEKKFRNFSAVAEDLVAEEQRGVASLHQPYANLANAIVSRIQAEQNWVETYNQLLFLMGKPPLVDREQITCGIKLEKFPNMETLKELDNCCFESLQRQILVKRPDITSLLLLEDSAYLNLKSALNSLLPSLNLLASFDLMNTNSCRCRNSDLYDSFPIDRPEKDVMVGLSLSFPFCNDQAKGLVRQQKAALLQAEVNTDQLEALLITAFNSAFSLNNALIKEWGDAQKAALEFAAATATEIDKLREGLSTYFDVLNLANDTATAQVQEIMVQSLYFQNLVQLYLLTGNLIYWEKCSDYIDVVDIREALCHLKE